jgi:hypothetical protein
MDTKEVPRRHAQTSSGTSAHKSAGIALGRLRPLLLGFSAVMLTSFRLQHRREELMQAARQRVYQVWDPSYRVIQVGQG